MSGGRSWEGDWKQRLQERVHQLGFASLTDFAAARPAVSTIALAEELGADDVNGVQVVTALYAEAEKRHQVRRLIRDLLARHLSEFLPQGWPAVLDDENRFTVAQALASWIAYVADDQQPIASQVARALLADPPPAGWCPLGPDDARLRALLPDE